MPILTHSDLKSDARTTGSRTISPSAKATPIWAPNWASRLSMSCRNVDAVSRVGTARRIGGRELAAMAGERRALGLVVRRDIDDKRRRGAVVDEVVADPLGPPGLGLGRVAAQSAAEHREVEHPAGGAVVGMSVLPVGQRDGLRPLRADRDPPPSAGFPATARCRRPASRGSSRHAAPRTRAASSASRVRSSGVPFVPSSPAVRSQRPTENPAAACRAIVPPRPISRSSGWGPKTSRSTGTR